MFDNIDPPVEGTQTNDMAAVFASAEVPVEESVPDRPKKKPARKKAAPKSTKPPVEEDLDLTCPEEKLYYIIALRRNITELKAKDDKTGKNWITIQKLQQKLGAALMDLAPKEVSYSNIDDVSLKNNSILGSRLKRKTYYA
jgi:hypothetical protein